MSSGVEVDGPETATATTGATGQSRARSVLREPAFLRLWVGTTASGLATWALPFVLGIGVVAGSLDAVGLGIALGVRTVGFLAAMPISGVLADRFSRRAIARWSGTVATLGSLAVAVGLAGTPAWLFVGAAVAGVGQGACRPPLQALVADVVDDARRQQANAAMTIAVRVTTLVAPATVALVSLALPVWALALGVAGLWVVAAVTPPTGAHHPAPTTAPAPGRGFLRGFGTDLLDGFREARRHPWFLAGLGALTAVIATGYSATGVVLPLVAAQTPGPGGGPALLATALTGYTAGALAGALLMGRWRPRARGWLALLGLGLYALVPLSLLGPAPAGLIVAAYVVCGFGIELFNVPWFTAVQREVDPSRLARVTSVDFLASYGLAPLGLALIAPAIAVFGAGPVLLGCAVVCLVAPAAAALVPSSRLFSREPSAVA